MPDWNDGCSWWLYTILVDNPSEFIKFMKDKKIEASQVHDRSDKHPQLSGLAQKLPGVDEFYAHQVCIPNGWWLSEIDKERIWNAIMDYDR